ncbi:DeoR/GlpR family DNA-binding transcription regulator [Desertimonas flava]|uniref:DeoR/GlpR family DNA-binding transcription regulator n=1 Tax=Desertimonas flava TaxID=2064846 RepID=UPI000E34D55F|nr:DeoR/GlpR family DNA-binding transcription regulator [Desertimonas flava]
MQRPERWNALLATVADEGRVDIDTAATRLAVSPATVRRDLDQLAEQQLVVRTRGGAVAHSVSYELPLRYKLSRHRDEKQRIATLAAELIAPASVVGVNGGTTTTEVARTLAMRVDPGPTNEQAAATAGLTIVTNALNIAHELAVRPHVKLVLTGGVLRPQSYELVGPLALPALERLALDVAVLGVDGLTAAAGATTNDETEAAVSELMTARARTVIVVADASKLGRRVFARVCDVASIDIVVTDRTADPVVVDELRAAGVDVQLA